MTFTRTPRLVHIVPENLSADSIGRLLTIMNSIHRPVSHQVIGISEDELFAGHPAGLSSLESRTAPAPLSVWPLQLHSYFKTLRRSAPDGLITYNDSSLDWALASLPLGLPHFHIEDSLNHDEPRKTTGFALWKRRCALAPRSQIVVSSRTLWSQARNDWRIPDDRVHYIPHGIEPTPADDPSVSAPWRERVLPAHKFLIGIMAPCNEDDNDANLCDIIQAMKTRHRCHLVILCEEPQQQTLSEQVEGKQLSDEVSLVNKSAWPRLAVDLDAWLVPVAAGATTIPVLQAMAAGLPVAAPDEDDLKYMVGNCNKHLLGSAQAASLAAALDELVDYPTLRTEISRQNRARIGANYSLQKMRKCFVTALSGFVASLPSRVPLSPRREPDTVAAGEQTL